jgi:hypothetical protein
MAAPEPAPAPLELDPKYDDYDYPTTAPVPANGHPGYLTPIQQAQVAQLRMHLEAEGFTERLDTLTLVCPRLPTQCLPRTEGGRFCRIVADTKHSE